MPQSKKIPHKDYRNYNGMNYENLKKQNRKFYKPKEAGCILNVELGVSYNEFQTTVKRELIEAYLFKRPDGSFTKRGIRRTDLEDFIENKLNKPAAIKKPLQ